MIPPVVILSRNLSNLGPCAAAIEYHEPEIWGDRLIVVDDDETGKIETWCATNGVTRIKGLKPFIFARNANLGLDRAFESHDSAVLLNDDALLRTRGGFTLLDQYSRENPSYGLISASVNSVGNENQHPQGAERLRREYKMLCFIAVLITKKAWMKIGEMDERFCLDYGVEDGDYSYRARLAGFKLGIVDRCFVDHASLVSTYRGAGHIGFEQNAELFKNKWGIAYGTE